MTRDFVEIVALALLICQQASWAGASPRDENHNSSPASNNPRVSVQIDLSSDEPKQASQQQIQYDMSSNAEVQGKQDNLKKYLLRGECDTEPANCIVQESVRLNSRPQHLSLQLSPSLSLDSTDLDYNGYMLKQSARDQWRLFQLRELLETLSSAIPTPSPLPQQQPSSSSSSSLQLPPIPSALPEPPPSQVASYSLPIYRSGRNKPSASSGLAGIMAGDAQLLAKSSPTYYRMANSNLGQQMTADKNIKARKQSILGVDWGAGNRPSAGTAMVTVRRSEVVPMMGDRASQALRHPLGSEEVAFTPMHSRSASDYEWKRVENLSKWNNLRGMWGKRSGLQSLMSRQDHMDQVGRGSNLQSMSPLQSIENQLVM